MDGVLTRRATKRSATIVAAGAAVLAALPVLAVTPGDIVLGDIVVMRIRTDSGGVSAEQRASMVQNRVNEILAIPNLTAKDVTIVPTKYGPTLYVHKVKLITVDADTAKDQGVTPDALAKTWAHRLMGIIAQVNIRLPGGPTPAAPATPVIAGSPAAPVTPLENVPPTTPAKTPDEKATTPAAEPPAKTPPTATPDDKKSAPAAPAKPTTPAKPDAPSSPTSPSAPATPGT